jgi:protoporphyrinogen IX oxidase
MAILVVKAIHILAVIAWMAGLLYLPRLFVYHSRTAVGSEADELFKLMELRLLRTIMNPAMIAVILLGATLVWLEGWRLLFAPWMWVKLAAVGFLTWFHHLLGRARAQFAAGERRRSERFWRRVNEAPFLAAAVIILAVVTRLPI